MIFQNRAQAAVLLADKLIRYQGTSPLVLGIPRGAVPMAKIIAGALDGDLDVVLVHKLGAPDQPELAIGAIDESGDVYLSEYVEELEVSRTYLENEEKLQLETLRRRRALYTPMRPPIDPAGRIVIVVDDGIATGATMIAALKTVRRKRPRQLIAATAVAPSEAIRSLEKEADRVVCLAVPEYFYSVGHFFREFGEVSDQEAVAILNQPTLHKTGLDA